MQCICLAIQTPIIYLLTQAGLQSPPFVKQDHILYLYPKKVDQHV